MPTLATPADVRPDQPSPAGDPGAERYEGLLSRFAPDAFPPLLMAIGLDPPLLEALDRRSATVKVLAIEPVAARVQEWAKQAPRP